MNKQSLLEVLEKATESGSVPRYSKDSVAERLYEMLDRYGYNKRALEVPGYVIQHEQTRGGSEGDGEEFWMVVSVKDTTSGETHYVRFDGYYQSYDGHEFNGDFDIVKPVQVQVTQWEVK